MKETRAFLRPLLPLAGVAAVAAAFYAVAPSHPFTALDLATIAVQTVILAIVASGMTLVIISGGLDLSVGSSVALAGVVVASLLNTDALTHASPLVRTLIAFPAAVITGILCGVYNATLITRLRIPPFIATLGTLGFFRGVAKWISGSSPIHSDASGLDLWVRPTDALGQPHMAPAVVVMGLVALAMAGLLTYTVLGRQAIAIGSNEEAARRCALPINRVKLSVYCICGGLVGLAGLAQFARLGGSGDPTIQVGLELKAVAAVVIGGASLAGGSGSILGTLAGALLMAILDNRATALGWPNYVQEIVVGHIIIGAVALDRWQARRRAA